MKFEKHMNQNIEQAIEKLRNQAGRYRQTKRYYAGEHNLQFATEKFATTFGELFREFALNLCPAIVDSVRDKLKITGFAVHDAAQAELATGTVAAPVIARIWRANRMAIRAGRCIKRLSKMAMLM